MDDRRLSLLCLVVAAVGIVGLFTVGLFVQPERVAVGGIDESMMGRIVTVSGTIERASESGGHYFFDIAGAESSDVIKAVMWASQTKSSDVEGLGKGSRIVATGQVASYRGELEIILNKISSVD